MALKKVVKKTSKPNIKIRQGKKSEGVVTNKFNDLHDVIDYSRDFSMFYSGVENDSYLSGCYNMGIRNFLMSFEYIQNKHLGNISEKYL